MLIYQRVVVKQLSEPFLAPPCRLFVSGNVVFYISLTFFLGHEQMKDDGLLPESENLR